MDDKLKHGFGTLCVSPSWPEEKPLLPHAEPIVATTAFRFQDAQQAMDIFAGDAEGYIYSRWSNPTVETAERKLALLESWHSEEQEVPELKAQLFSSGMAAISGFFMACLRPGDKILTQKQLYGGTDELIRKVMKRLNIESIVVDMKKPDEIDRLLEEDLSINLIYIETPSNPMINCVDIRMIARIAGTHGIKLAVDNTFCSPYLQQPIRLGADFSIHSTTKFLNGHGNALGGVVIGKDLEFMKGPLWEQVKLMGANSNAFDAWLLNNGLKTLEIRMQRHCENARKVAVFLNEHPAVKSVNFCGLPDHPDHELAKRQMRDFGAMLSFELKGGLDAGISCMNKVKLCTLATTLGTVDTLIQHPSSMTHVCVPREERLANGITDGLVRLSVGIENIEDIIEDLNQSLS